MKHVIILPDLGQTTSEAKVLQWHKRVGERVRRGEPILEVETDKVDMDVESYVEGYLRKTLVEEGEMATALEPVAILTDTPEEEYVADGPAEPAAAGVEAKAGWDGEAASAPRKRQSGPTVAPAARRLAEELNVDLSKVTGTGRDGLIMRKDIESFLEQRTSSNEGAVKPPRALAAMAAITAESKKQIPHFYLTRHLDIESASQWRADWNEKHPAAKATFNDLFVRAAGKALRDVPRFNLGVRDGSYEQRQAADILLVVAGEEGLSLIPVADPCDLPWPEFLQQIRKAARGGSAPAVADAAGIRPSLAVSNLGMHQVDSFAAIIPPGCTAVLAIGSVTPTPVVEQDEVVVRRRCKVTVSADHRVVDGVTAAVFMERMQLHLNDL